MTETVETSFSCGERTASIVRDRVIEKSDEFDSVKRFFEISIATRIGKIGVLASGGKQCRILIDLLDQIQNIEVEKADYTYKINLLDENVSEMRPRVELTPKEINRITEARNETGASQAQIIRCCILYQLYKISQESKSIFGWRKEEIESTWTEARNSLIRPKLKFYDILQRRFCDERESTISKIQKDRQRFDKFAQEYARNFHGSELYNELILFRGERVFNNTEEVIEEYSKYDLNVFLQGFPEVEK